MTTAQQPAGTGPSRTHRIVVGTDGSEGGSGAVAWAAAEALQSGSVLEVVTSFGTGYVLVNQHEANEAMDKVLHDAQALAERSAPGVVVRTRSHPGSPEVVLLDEALGADLLVVGSRGLGGFKGRLLGSVSRRCVHRSPCPVVVVKDGVEGVTARRSAPGHHIMVGVDGSPTTVEAVEWAVREAERSGAVVDLVTAWEFPSSYGGSLAIPSDWDPGADSRSIVDKVVAPVQAAHPGVSIRSTVLEGHPSQVLDERSVDADLLVLGCRGHGEFAGMLLGSVSEYSVVHARCPVLVLRHADPEVA
jgi:nucleotide-binding universal stress UspA family protein